MLTTSSGNTAFNLSNAGAVERFISLRNIAETMWKVLGKETIYLDIGETAKEMLAKLAADDGGDEFRELLQRSEVQFMINGTTEYCNFIFRLPDDLTPEQIQLMADSALAVVTGDGPPMIEAEGTELRFLLIFSNSVEPELIGIRKTPGMSAGPIFNRIVESYGSRGE